MPVSSSRIWPTRPRGQPCHYLAMTYPRKIGVRRRGSASAWPLLLRLDPGRPTSRAPLSVAARQRDSTTARASKPCKQGAKPTVRERLKSRLKHSRPERPMLPGPPAGVGGLRAKRMDKPTGPSCRRRSAIRPADRSDFHACAACALRGCGRLMTRCVDGALKPGGPSSTGVPAPASTASPFAGQHARSPLCAPRVVREEPRRGKRLSLCSA
jgi:hypothetical protein